jgi:DNA-binding beta-propeller fold protein YncE
MLDMTAWRLVRIFSLVFSGSPIVMPVSVLLASASHKRVFVAWTRDAGCRREGRHDGGGRGLAAVALCVLLALGGGRAAQAVIRNNDPAVDVLGQFALYNSEATPSYTNACANNGITDIGFDSPEDVVIDTVNKRLFLADSSNNRVLVFTLNNDNTLGSKVPTAVLGQPDTRSCGSNVPRTIQSGLDYPCGLAYDSSNNRLFVADKDNNRILVFDVASITNGENAVNVLGQSNFTSNAVSGATQSSFGGTACSLAYDSGNNRLFVGDASYHRVMVFDVASITNGENAVNVLGQSNFTGNTAQTTQSGMSFPIGLTYDAGNNRLFVADHNNKRVTVFDVASITNGENAVNVLGQANFTSSTQAVTQAGMHSPYGLAYDASGNRLFVSEVDAHRVMVYDVASITNGENAINVLGQSGYTFFGNNTSWSGFSAPRGMAHDSTNNLLYVADYSNNRVMQFNVASITNGESASDLLGQYSNGNSTATTVGTQSVVDNNGRPPVTDLGFWTPQDILLDAANRRLYVSEINNNRVLVYNLNPDLSLPDRTPDAVLGQPDFTSNQAATTQSGMDSPYGLALDRTGNRLFVADRDNARVLIYDVASITNGENAVNVLGQSNFTSAGGGVTSTTFALPTALAYDASNNRLFVADATNHRVLVFDVASISNGEAAVNVLGQTNFTNAGAANSQTRMNLPQGLAYDAARQRLFVAQINSNRVTVYDVVSITNGEAAINVLGQINYTNSSAATTQAGLSTPDGISFDANNNRLFVADWANNRVMVFNTATISNGMSAAHVLGQANFTSSGSATSQTGFNGPAGILFAPETGRLYVVEENNHRVIIFDGTTINTNAQSMFGLGYE